MKKIVLSIICSFILLFICYVLGLFTPYNYFTAKRDIKKNKICKVIVNRHIMRFAIERTVGRKYGVDVKSFDTGDDPNPLYIMGPNTYNRLMMDELKKIKGELFFNKYKNELDSVNRSVIVK